MANNRWLADGISFSLGQRALMPVEMFGRMAKEERDPVQKLFYIGLCASIPCAWMGNAVNSKLGFEYPGGLLLVSCLLLLVQLPAAFFLLRRVELIRRPFGIKWLLAFGASLLAALLLTYLFLWFGAAMQANAAVLKESVAKMAPGKISGDAPGWGMLLLTFLYFILFLTVPLFISISWTTMILICKALTWKKPVAEVWWDMVEGHLEGAVETYCSSKDRQEEELTGEEWEFLNAAATGPVAFFMNWVIFHDFEGEIHKRDPRAADEVRAGRRNAADFVTRCCDSQLREKDVSPEIFEFVAQYYDHYLDDYFRWAAGHEVDGTGLYPGTPGDYPEFSKVIDRNYLAWRIRQEGGSVARNQDGGDNPFRIWDGREEISPALVWKACGIYEEAKARTLSLARLPEAERSAAFLKIIRDIVMEFNILDRYNEFIDTAEREEIYGIAVSLWQLGWEQCGLAITNEEFTEAFDQDREW